MGEKEIRLNGTVVGSAAVAIDGLYAHIKCRCSFPNKKIYALFFKNDTGDRLLGTCTPQNGCYVLDVKIPKKYMIGTTTIYAAEKYADDAKEAVPLVPGEPVASVENLERSVFRVENGRPFLLI